MKHPRAPRGALGSGAFFQFSLTCTCDPDRLIQDHLGVVHCGECMEPLEKVDSRELPLEDQNEILTKLKFRKRIVARDAELGAKGKGFGESDDEDE